MKTRLLIITGIVIVVIISTGLIFNFFVLNTLDDHTSGSIFSQPPFDYVLIASLENDFDYDSLSFQEKRIGQEEHTKFNYGTLMKKQ